MKLEFKDFHCWGSNCQYFPGVKDHGPKVEFDLTDNDEKELGFVGSDGVSSVHIHADGTMYATTMSYNYRKEEYQQTIVKDLTDNTEFKQALNSWLKENNLYQSNYFPFPISTRPDVNSEKIADSLFSLLLFVKNLK